MSPVPLAPRRHDPRHARTGGLRQCLHQHIRCRARRGRRELLGQHHQPDRRARRLGDVAHHEPQRRPPPLRDRCSRRRHPGPGAGHDRERRGLRHLDGLTPRCGRWKSAGRQRGDRAPHHRERPQPPPLVRHPPRADRGRAIAGALEKAAPRDAATFKSNLATFDASLAPLNATLAIIRAHFHNVPVAYTERVPGYALAVADLDVKTPPGFARAIEDGTDPGPADTLAMQQLLDRP